MPELVVVHADGQVQRLPLGLKTVLLGREQACDVCLADPKVSRRHARIRPEGDGWLLEDLGSVNGYLVDGVASRAPTRLVPGMVIQLGQGRFSLEEAAGAATPYFLEVVAGLPEPSRFALAPGEQGVGRGSESAIALPHPSVSRQHARIYVADHALTVEDLGSSNGSFVNEQRLQRATVQAGDVLGFGQVRLRLQRDAAAVVEVSAVARSVESRMRANLPALAPEGPADREAAPADANAEAGPQATAAPAGSKARRLRAAVARLLGHRKVPAPTARRLPSKRAGRSVAALLLGVGLLTAFWRLAPEGPRNGGTAGDAPALAAATGAPSLWRRLLGQGPSAEEQAFVRAQHGKVLAAEAKLAAGEAAAARALFGEVLAAEPIHPRALLGRRRARLVQAEAKDLTGSEEAVKTGHPFEALVAASSGSLAARQLLALRASAPGSQAAGGPEAVDGDGLDGPEAAVWRQKLRQLAATSQHTLARTAAEQAQVACSTESYASCLEQAACALAFAPSSEAARALVSLTADAVAGRAVLPNFSPPADAAPASQADGATDAGLGAVTALYPQPALRRALLTYAAGNLDGAKKKLRNIDSGKSRALLADVLRVEQLLGAGQAADEKDRADVAGGAFAGALEVDKRLLPGLAASAPRELAVQGLQGLALRDAQAAFDRGAWAEGRAALQKGLALAPGFAPLVAAEQALATRAAQLLAAAQAGPADKTKGPGADAPPKGGDASATAAPPLPEDPCAAAQQALDLVDADGPLAERARKVLARCKGGKQPKKKAVVRD